MIKYISCAGQLNQGKDVLCDYLYDKLGDKWKRAAFANAVKEVYEKSFGVTREFIEKWKRIPEPPPGMLMNVRQGLQFIGDGFRKIKENIWIEIALREPYLIISDSRYINEAKEVAEQGGVNILVWRPGYENNDPNPSESQIKPIIDWCIKTKQNGPMICENYHYFMINDGTIDDLKEKINRELIPWINNNI